MATISSSLIVKLIDGVSGPARAAAASLRGVSAAAGGVRGGVGAVMRENSSAVAGFTRSLLGVAATAAVAGFAIKRTFGGALTAAAEFESAMADVRKVVDFGSAGEFKGFSKTILDLSQRLPVAAQGLAQIAAAAGQAGLAKEDLIGFTEMVAKTAVAFDITADTAGDALAKIKTALGLTVAETGLLADAFNHLSNAQASSASDILDFFRRAGTDGRMFGFATAQTAAFGSAMISSGAQADVAATSFRNMGRALTRGEAATKSQRRAFAALGLGAVKTAKLMQKDAVGTTIDVLERINKLPKHMQASIASSLFGDEARALMPLITNLALLRESLGLVAEQTRYAGSAAKEYEVRSKTFANATTLFQNRFEGLKIAIGNLMMPAVSRWMGEFGLMFSDVADALDTVDQKVGVFDRLGAALGGLAEGLGFGGMADIRSGLQGLLTGLLGDTATFDADSKTLAESFKSFREMGASVRDFAVGVKEAIDPVLAFLGISWTDIGTAGVTLAAAAIGFAAFAKAIRLLAGALFFLSGAKTGLSVLRALGIVGGGAALGSAINVAGLGAVATVIRQFAKRLGPLALALTAYEGLTALVASLNQPGARENTAPDPLGEKYRADHPAFTPPEGGSKGYYDRRMEERNKFRARVGLPPVGMDGSAAPAGGGIGSDHVAGVARQAQAAKVAVESLDNATGTPRIDTSQLQEAIALAERLRSAIVGINGTAVRIQTSPSLGQAMRGIHSDTGIE